MTESQTNIPQRIIRNERVQAWIQILLGCVIGGIAYPLFLTPASIAPGGLTGVAMIIHHYTNYPIGLVSFAMNVPLFVIGYHSMGKLFAFRSLIATVLFSAVIDLSSLQPMTDDPLLSAIYGGAMLGLGLGLIIRGGATTGGTDMMAQMVHARFQFISTGAVLFAIDFIVIVAASLTIGQTQALYAIICVFIADRVIDMIIAGFTSNKACFIISERWEAITERIMREMDRGVTQMMAKGAYTGKSRPVVLCVISRTEVARMKDIVRQTDGNAFVFITEAHEALGEGFSRLSGDK